MADHDQLFKTLLRTFFAEFFELFFPEWVARFDFGSLQWLDKELFVSPPQGQARYVDVLAQVGLRQPAVVGDRPWLALIHVEVESADSVAPLRRRMLDYYDLLRRDTDLPVLPLALYLGVDLGGVGWDHYEETFWEHVLVRFQYPYVGLPALDGENYVNRDNWLGVALSVLMRVPPERRAELSQQAWRRLVQCPLNDYQRHLLLECVGTYSPLSEEEFAALESAVANAADPGVRAMSVGLIEKWRNEGRQQGQQKGLQEGQQKGRQEGQRLMLVSVLESQFGSLPAAVRDRIDTLTSEEIEVAFRAFRTAKSLADLGLNPKGP